MTFGQRVRWYRESLNLTQGELAVKAGMTRSSITNIEADKQNLRLSCIHAIAHALDVPPAALLTDKSVDDAFLQLIRRRQKELQALRETQQEQGERIDANFAELKADVAEIKHGITHIVTLLERLEP